MSVETAEATVDEQQTDAVVPADEVVENPYEYDEADTESQEGVVAPAKEEAKTETEEPGEVEKAPAEEVEGEDEDSAPAEETDEVEDDSESEPVEDKPKTSAPAFDAQLLTIAQSMGIPAEMARGYGSNAGLKQAMATLATSGRTAGQAPLVPAQAAPEPPPRAEPKPKAPAFEIPEFTEDEHGEAAVKMAAGMKAQQAYWEQRNQEQTDMLSGVFKQLDGFTKMAAQERFDMHVASLGEAYADELGAGSSNAMATDSSEFAKRNELFNEMSMRRDGFLQRNLPPPSEAALFEHARRIVFGDKTAAIARKTVEAKTRKRRGQTISRPTGRKPKPLTGEEKFAAGVDEHLRGMDLQQSPDEF